MKLENRAYKIETKDRKILKEYYNSNRLAKYHKKQVWELVIVI